MHLYIIYGYYSIKSIFYYKLLKYTKYIKQVLAYILIVSINN